jgi:TRAP-type mannitol/chloroaromatic compound transport system permease small subunit
MSFTETIADHSDTFIAPSNGAVDLSLRVFGCSSVGLVFVFLANNHLTFWQNWPGALALMVHQGWFGGDTVLDGDALTFAWIQLLLYLAAVAMSIAYVYFTRARSMCVDAQWMGALAAFLVRVAFWATFLIGLADMAISFLRVEGLLEALTGAQLYAELGRPTYRATYVHIPLIGVSIVIALLVRSLGFIWLTLLVVLAEFQIVILRFVFSYEQVFMGDLVRFWYAALFLFASAYTLIEDGHVRVDVFYARFSARGKAWVNSLGSVLLGLPLCWVILTQGMWGRGSSLNSPLLSFEISQSGYGLYVKYLMAGFLVVFSVTMIIQFSAYILSNAAVLRGQVASGIGAEDSPAGSSA